MQVPVAVGSASIGIIRHVLHKKKARKKAKSSQELAEAGQKPVTLQWDHVSCTLTTKKGGVKKILQDVSGKAKPGRCVPFQGQPQSCRTGLSFPQSVIAHCTCVRPSTCHRPSIEVLLPRLLAIMGPSGGGKTSLLNALAGQVPETKGKQAITYPDCPLAASFPKSQALICM